MLVQKAVVLGKHAVDDALIHLNGELIVAVRAAGHLENESFVVVHTVKQLNLLTGQSFRLPNEEEWEFAARGGLQSQGFTFAGSNDIRQVAWYEANSGMTPQPVATKAPNELGLYDMSGNIFEWCHNNFYRYDTPSNPTTGKTRRGGGWNSSPKNCRVSFRYDNEPDKRSQIIGMRLAI